MNAYGGAGQSYEPDPNEAYGAEASRGGGYDDIDRRVHSARASVPPAPGGRASARVPVGRASVASGPPAGRVGRAAVPLPTQGFSEEPEYDLAAVSAAPARPVTGRAPVGRATVRQVPPARAVPGSGGPDDPNMSDGGPRGPGGPSGRRKRRRRANWIIGTFAVLITLTGGGVVGVTYYADSVIVPEDFDKLALSSTVMYSDGKTEIAKLGTVNRVYSTIAQIPDYVEQAVASAEDRNFYTHGGIDYRGIMRAAWNNVTGGETQGASTITQQYARNALDLQGVNYARKVREAVVASKLTDDLPKSTIMEYYLNTIYFGRGAYSIESAAQAYFKKPINRLTLEEAAVLAAVIKQPVPSDTHQGYDPADNLEEAKLRWAYVLDGMVERFGLDPAKRAKMQYPRVQPWNSKTACVNECGLNTPAGNVVNYVIEEMAATGECKLTECRKALDTGGYRVTTSIDRRMQAHAEAIVRRKKEGNLLSKANNQTKNVFAAMAAVEPGSGRVLAYYGGESGSGFDYAGRNKLSGRIVGGRPPGSSFKVYTLAAALDAGISMKSRWKARDIKTPFAVRNAGNRSVCGDSCTLEESTLRSYNVPFYYVTDKVGADKVLDAARKAGIEMMWDNEGRPRELTTTTIGNLANRTFDEHVGFGQFGVTVLEHANGLATFANRGVYNKAHFMVKLEKKNRVTGKWELKEEERRKPQERFRKEVMDDLNATLQKVSPSHRLDDNRPAARKTGTWEAKQGSLANADVWMAGYTRQIATAVWVGSSDRKPVLEDGENMASSGLPSDIWKKFMDEAHDGMEIEEFAPPRDIGDVDSGNGLVPRPTDPACNIPFVCPDTPPDRGRPGDGGGGDNGRGGDDDGRGRGRGRGGFAQPTFPPIE